MSYAVQVDTQQEWNEVVATLWPGFSTQYRQERCLYWDGDYLAWGDTERHVLNNKESQYPLLTFDEWKARYAPPESDFSIERYERQVVQLGTHVVQQRCGLPARVLCIDAKTGDSQPVLALSSDDFGTETGRFYQADGRWGYVGISPYDLIIVPKPKPSVTIELGNKVAAYVDYENQVVTIDARHKTFLPFSAIRELHAAINAQP